MRLFYFCLITWLGVCGVNHPSFAEVDDANAPMNNLPQAAGEPQSSDEKVDPIDNTGDDSAASAEGQARFDIMEFQVSGNSVLPQGKIEQAVYPFLGESKTIDDVEAARAALEKTFHEAGYLTVFVNTPEQDVDHKMVRLEVQEGKVEKLRVVGARYYSLGAIKARTPDLAEGKVPYFPNVQRQLAGLNTQADRQVAPVLRPGKTPGKVEVDLKVEDKLPLHANLELNNRYIANTTHTRLNGSVRYDNLWQKDHSLSLSFQVTPENTDETKVLSATYLIPTPSGDYWAFYGVSSRSDVAAVGDVNVIGNGTILGLRYIHPLPAPALSGYFHNLTLGVDYKDFKESTRLVGTGFNTPISYMPFFAGYDSTLQTEKSTTQFNLGLTFAVRNLGSDEQEFFEKRSEAQGSFAYLRGDIKHTYKLPRDWELFGRLSGQATGAPIIANEQFVVGGADTVRGYYEASALGDKGLFGTAELRTPSLTRYLDMEGELVGSVFYSAGQARILKPLAQQNSVFNLASIGVGLQLRKWHGVTAVFDYARAMRTAGFVEKGDTLLHFRVAYDW
ncbi:ShlB/FhaC/HecB family hemolysin secretion/activation protein [Methylobacillus gramineus]|uniref:ShlB/FhaC/HecB family hemolysin secretion/activation protein n=1 Tax=Methylobacillus gramineus TaxID=755169 RepID=UPI001CFF5DFB|nr:ShlB/FhaC/HecB family hemolysin secretion/activation protein [Methylobacillus gramineus]MCB5186041.1 ShlB/FhaC/HecB family hemolysin secretion/activation protein [Methylobacillus gramineus]